MRAYLLIGVAALGLAACGRDDRAEDANMADANMTMEENLALDMNADANVDVNADTANAMAEDLTTNDADTNLANGM
jgi:hypothetical protein